LLQLILSPFLIEILFLLLQSLDSSHEMQFAVINYDLSLISEKKRTAANMPQSVFPAQKEYKSALPPMPITRRRGCPVSCRSSGLRIYILLSFPSESSQWIRTELLAHSGGTAQVFHLLPS